MAAEEFDIQKRYEKKKEEERQREKGIIEDKKRIVHVIKLYISPNSAKPGPPIGPVLGQHQINTNDFCKEFNKLTEKLDNKLVLPVLVFKKADRTFDIVLRNPTTSYYIGNMKTVLNIKSTAYKFNPYVVLRYVVLNKFVHFQNTRDRRIISDIKFVKTILGSLRSAKIKIANIF